MLFQDTLKPLLCSIVSSYRVFMSLPWLMCSIDLAQVQCLDQQPVSWHHMGMPQLYTWTPLAPVIQKLSVGPSSLCLKASLVLRCIQHSQKSLVLPVRDVRTFKGHNQVLFSRRLIPIKGVKHKPISQLSRAIFM